MTIILKRFFDSLYYYTMRPRSGRVVSGCIGQHETPIIRYRLSGRGLMSYHLITQRKCFNLLNYINESEAVAEPNLL